MPDQHGFLYDWQTLIAGGLAICAAVVTVVWAEGYSRRREKREVEGIKASLSVEIRAIIDVLLDAHQVLKSAASLLLANKALLAGKIGLVSGEENEKIRREWREIKASSIKFATELPEPTVYRASADRIGRLGELAPFVTAFYIALDRINVGVKVVTDVDMAASLSDEDARNMARLFEQACRTSLPLLTRLPPDEGDAELRKRIESLSWTGEETELQANRR